MGISAGCFRLHPDAGWIEVSGFATTHRCSCGSAPDQYRCDRAGVGGAESARVDWNEAGLDCGWLRTVKPQSRDYGISGFEGMAGELSGSRSDEVLGDLQTAVNELLSAPACAALFEKRG